MQIETAIVKSIINQEGTLTTPLFESYGPNTDLLSKELLIAEGGNVNLTPPGLREPRKANTKMTKKMWVKAQNADPAINQIITLIKSKTLGHRKHHNNDSPELKSMLRVKNQLILRNGLLYRKMKKNNKEGSVLEFVVPKSHRLHILQACHDDVGHAGIWKCSRLLRNRFYWANINQDIEQYIKRCVRCLKIKTKQEVAPKETIHVTHPMELVHMDCLTIESNKQDKDVNILVVTDHFTRLAHDFVTPSQTASVVAKTPYPK